MIKGHILISYSVLAVCNSIHKLDCYIIYYLIKNIRTYDTSCSIVTVIILDGYHIKKQQDFQDSTYVTYYLLLYLLDWVSSFFIKGHIEHVFTLKNWY